MIYLNKRKWIYISLENPLKTIKKLKGIFKPLKRYFRCSFKEWDYSPVLWCSKPAYIHIMSRDVMWKDKYDSPRFEGVPYIWVHLWKMNLIWYWSIPSIEFYSDDEYWEQALWYLYYYENYKMKVPDIIEAEKYWPWEHYVTKKSTWNSSYLLDYN